MSFLPEGYERPKNQNRFFKIEQGDNKIRILSSAVIGWLDWEDGEDGKRKPVRTKEKQSQTSKHFWAFVVYDYEDKTIKMAEITQATLQDQIFELHSNDAWGDPTGYDLKIKKTGQKMETKYFVTPENLNPPVNEIMELYSKENINFDNLFKGESPFVEDEKTAPATEEQATLPDEEPSFK